MPNATAKYLPEGLLNDEVTVCPAHKVFLHYLNLRVCRNALGYLPDCVLDSDWSISAA
jgi:hypothetical protein